MSRGWGSSGYGVEGGLQLPRKCYIYNVVFMVHSAGQHFTAKSGKESLKERGREKSEEREPEESSEESKSQAP